MISINNWLGNISSISREVKGKIELVHSGSIAPYATLLPTDKLQSIQIEKTPVQGKCFGIAISQKAIVKVLDRDDEIPFEKDDLMGVSLGVVNKATGSGGTLYAGMPPFYIHDVVKDEVSGVKTITAYDVLNEAKSLYQEQLEIEFPITIKDYAAVIAQALNLNGVVWECKTAEPINIEYTKEQQPNVEGTETLWELLAAIAEATGTICFINWQNSLVFKQLRKMPCNPILKADYFELKLGEKKMLTKITHATELGENISVGNDNGGLAQVIRNNPFLENRADIADVLTQLLVCLPNIQLYDYNIKWRGNPQLEIGDCLAVFDKHGMPQNIYFIDETITYNGGLLAISKCEFNVEEKPDATPSTIGEIIKETYAKVDKVNKEIKLVASETAANKQSIAAIELNTDSISQSVSGIETKQTEHEEFVSGELATIKEKVSQTITKEEIRFEVEKVIEENGITSVVTNTGFTFDSEGLTVSKSNNEMKTQITEDGMTVYKDGEAMLVASHTGVIAKDLHAETYLIIGKYSRFEDYEKNSEARTGCFWIGGNN